ncbi:tonoplast intrinsic protein 5 [Perilla frutescens var. hirtella]|uniref:Tonoplast intrinsic protein 5 n=1 Tax=Perilla frutescens var. hirtella TaxID=608512 RepID=A0AAD4PBD5_PERFH|nr:tonoplast intrinsic protein 5 [Perilla frutescens var. hirtella]
MASLKSRLQHSFTPAALRSYLAEFISTFLFVFASVGAATSAWKMAPAAASDPSSLTAIAIANAFALSAAVYIAANISGGHVNPAVTFGMAVGGHITIPTAVFYWIAQMLASVMACLLLKTLTVGQHIPIHTIPSEMTGFGASILEGTMTFGLVYTVYASRRVAAVGGVGPLAVGFIVGANVLASGPFTGGSMNPACAFGAALIGGSFKNQAVYWVGPLIGAALAGILYDNVVFPVQATDDSLRGVSDGVGDI